MRQEQRKKKKYVLVKGQGENLRTKKDYFSKYLRSLWYQVHNFNTIGLLRFKISKGLKIVTIFSGKTLPVLKLIVKKIYR